MSAPTSLLPPPPPRPRRRWPKLLAGGLVLLAVAVWFAPAVVANTSLRNRLARSAAADLNGTVEVGGASLGWLSPVELRDVTLTDAQGRVVARVPRVASGRRLASLLWDRSDPGEFVLDRPAVEVVRGADGTNLEDVFRKFLADDGKPAGPTRTPLALKITGGTLTVRDAATGRAGEVRDVDATVRVPASRSEPVAVAASGSAPGRFEMDASLGSSNRVKVVAAGVALETAAPLLRRLDPGVAAAGTLTADLTATWGNDAATVEGTLGAKDLAVTAPALDGETLRLASAELPLKVAVAGRTVRIDRADLTCDVGTASVAGTFDPAEPLDKLLDRPGVRVAATVDVAKLAAALPRLLRVRDGTALREGKLTVKVESAPGPDGTAWAGGVTTSALKAVRDGREIVWDEPLAVEFAARVRAGGFPTFDRLTCKSDFVAVNAEVKPDSVRAAANVYLDRLAARLADFVDLGGVALDGQGSVRVVARRTAGGAFAAEAAVELKRFALTDRAGKGLREPALVAQLRAAGTAPDAGPVAVSTATLDVTAGTDELHLTLLEPVPDVKNVSAGALDARLSGDLGRWRARAALLAPVLDGYEMGGKATAGGVVRFGPGAVRADRLTLSVDNIRFVGAGLDIAEPNLNAVADLTVDRKAGTATFAEFTVNSAPLSVARGKLVIESPPGGPLVVHGAGPAVSDLNRLGKSVGVFADPNGPSAVRGTGTGPVRFRYAGDVTTFGGALDVTHFAYGPKAAPDWTEPTLRVELDGSYTRSTDTVAFTSARVNRPGLELAARGSVGRFDTTTDADLTGTLSYDWAQLTPKLRELLGGNFAAAGKGTKPVRLAGSLTPPARPGSKVPPSALAGLTADLALGWDAAHAYGFDLGPAEVRAAVANGVARVSPVSATFGGGKVTLEPTVRLDPAPGEVTFAKGRVVDRAKLTPAATAGALGYALPAVANAAKAEGEVSVVLDENRVPLADPRGASLKGTVVIHSATVTAGPVMGAVAQLLGDDAAMTLAEEQAVPVRVENGRVYHDGLTVKVGAYLVKTSGSVGFDGTVDLVADVPIPGGLPGLRSTPAVAKAIAGKRVAVPIRGTLGKPALDPKAFQAAVARVAQDAARDVGRDLLNKELEKLLPGGMPGGGKPGGLFPFPLPKK